MSTETACGETEVPMPATLTASALSSTARRPGCDRSRTTSWWCRHRRLTTSRTTSGAARVHHPSAVYRRRRRRSPRQADRASTHSQSVGRMLRSMRRRMSCQITSIVSSSPGRGLGANRNTGDHEGIGAPRPPPQIPSPLPPAPTGPFRQHLLSPPHCAHVLRGAEPVSDTPSET
jgi:hypothetical protein